MAKTRAGVSRRRKSSGRGTLVIISALLIGSAMVRVSSDAGQAIAKTSPIEEIEEKDHVAAECKPPEDLQPVLEAFRQREERISRHEIALQDRMQALNTANREIERKLAQLTEAENNLRETIALADTAAESDLDRLTKVYENMKPKQAAALFEEMDPSFAAGFIGRMRPEAAAAGMAGLSPEAAHAFSVMLAGRNTNVPTE